jgi:PAS domain S-box-containing protein
VVRWNAAAEETLGQSANEVLKRPLRQCGARWDWDAVLTGIDRAIADGSTVRLEDLEYVRPDGTRGILELIITQVLAEANQPDGYTVLGRDVSRQRLVESQLAQAQKLEAMGELAAGIAHEINTPTQYVGDNTRFLQEAFGDLREFLLAVRQAVAPEQGTPAAPAELAQRWEQMDLGYLLDEVPQAIGQSLEGIDRVKSIVTAMKEFSHPQEDQMSPVDLNHAIRSTVTVCRNEWKYVAEMELDLDEELPPVPCHAGEINQVVLNLTVNAAHAIQEQLGHSSDQKGRITIHTEKVGEGVEIRVSDTGCGIPPEIQAKVFDLFFTTKPAGRGTGQGLAIARAAVVEKHGGSLEMVSQPGEGTTFIIRLPLRAAGPKPASNTEEAIESL